MEGRPSTAESKHTYRSGPWTRLTLNTSSPKVAPTSIPEPCTPIALSANLEFYPILFPQSIYQAQLLNYNRLISPGRGGGGGLQTPPLPPILSAPHIQAAPQSRPQSASSKVSSSREGPVNPGTPGTPGTPITPSAQSCHGNRPPKNTDKSDRALITGREMPSKMPTKKADPTRPLPSRPHVNAAAATGGLSGSSSVPSTPQQHARKFSLAESQETSPNTTQNHSPRSAYSETNPSVPSLRPLPPRSGGCRYETALAGSKRRMQYSIGSDRLPKEDLSNVPKKLAEDKDKKLSTDMRELFDRLLPTAEVEEKRTKLVQKLETLFNGEWPGHKIRVHLFGSSGNLLCSDDSDVDMCITTDWKEMENVCAIAGLLARSGMEKVVCVSSAKVPIVKIWDPELGLACDMNVNNTLALDNTRMVRTYVEIDERVRQLMMIIKYWTRKRIVNDAAFGGTLSSYTWICLIIAFLQLRDPPVLPALHQRPHMKVSAQSAFADDLTKLRGFGKKNKESLGELLFQFFRFYAHEFDYDKNALSIRLGKVIPKTSKKWHLAINNMLCIEEPFNTHRNLGNTADDTSFRGLHLELRRAFDLILEAKLDECCEQYVYPKEEERPLFQKPAPAPRPVLLRSASHTHTNRGGRGGNFRGGRGGGHNNRNGNNSRRASSSVAQETTAPMYVPVNMALPEATAAWYQQQYAYHPDMLSSAMNALQIQENSLRFQLYQQSQAYQQQQALAHASRLSGSNSASQQATERPRTNSIDSPRSPPMSAPAARQQPPEVFMYYPLYAGHYYAQPGFGHPASPSTSTGAPEFRRSLHRSAVTGDSGASSSTLRSQSQPASRSAAIGVAQSYPGTAQPPNGVPTFPTRHANGVPIPSFIPDENVDSEVEDGANKSTSTTPPGEDGARYAGYYLSGPKSPARKPPNGIPAFGDISVNSNSPNSQRSQSRRRLSTDTPHAVLDRAMRRTSRSPSPMGHARAFSVGTNSTPLPSVPFPGTNLNPGRDTRPVVVNGSGIKPGPATANTAASSRQPSVSESTVSEDLGFDNPLHISQGQGYSSFVSAAQPTVSLPQHLEPGPAAMSNQPLVVNGSTPTQPTAPPLPVQTPPSAQSFHQRVVAMNGLQSVPYATVAGEGSNAIQPPPRLSPNSRDRTMSRQQQAGIAPLDLAIGSNSLTPESAHLSPVYEMRTPSPTVMRKFDPPNASDRFAGKPGSSKPSKPEVPKFGPKQPEFVKQEEGRPVQHPRVNGMARENGHVRGAKSESDWQKAKPRKKGVEVKNAPNAFPQSEQSPKNDAERKGG